MSARLLVDCDPGQDDAVALLLAAASPEFDLVAVTTVAGNVGAAQTAANARRALANHDGGEVSEYFTRTRRAAPRSWAWIPLSPSRDGTSGGTGFGLCAPKVGRHCQRVLLARAHLREVPDSGIAAEILGREAPSKCRPG